MIFGPSKWLQALWGTGQGCSRAPWFRTPSVHHALAKSTHYFCTTDANSVNVQTTQPTIHVVTRSNFTLRASSNLGKVILASVRNNAHFPGFPTIAWPSTQDTRNIPTLCTCPATSYPLKCLRHPEGSYKLWVNIRPMKKHLGSFAIIREHCFYIAENTKQSNSGRK